MTPKEKAKVLYEEALIKAFNSEWKSSVCSQGEECWCRIIEPLNKIEYDNGEEIYIVGSGSISKEFAEYIVKLHNNNLINYDTERKS